MLVLYITEALININSIDYSEMFTLKITRVIRLIMTFTVRLLFPIVNAVQNGQQTIVTTFIQSLFIIGLFPGPVQGDPFHWPAVVCGGSAGSDQALSKGENPS